MGTSNWQYFMQRIRDSHEFKWGHDVVVAVLASVIGYLILDRKAAWDNLIAAVVIGLGATIVFELGTTTWRFIWTVPRNDHRYLEVMLDRLKPKFKVEKLIPQPTETNDKDTTKIYLQVLPECLTDAPIEECQAWLLLVSRPNHNGKWIPTEMNSPLKLGWDYYGYGAITLQPSIPQRLCICYWDNHSTAIVPTVEPLPSKWKSLIGPGPFKFDVRMKGKGCGDVDFCVTVSLLGCKWDKPDRELIQGHQAAAVKSLYSRASE